MQQCSENTNTNTFVWFLCCRPPCTARISSDAGHLRARRCGLSESDTDEPRWRFTPDFVRFSATRHGLCAADVLRLAVLHTIHDRSWRGRHQPRPPSSATLGHQLLQRTRTRACSQTTVRVRVGGRACPTISAWKALAWYLADLPGNTRLILTTLPISHLLTPQQLTLNVKRASSLAIAAAPTTISPPCEPRRSSRRRDVARGRAVRARRGGAAALPHPNGRDAPVPGRVSDRPRRRLPGSRGHGPAARRRLGGVQRGRVELVPAVCHLWSE